MKLYTEEQMIEVLFTYPHPESTPEELLKDITPIELPSDDEIEENMISQGIILEQGFCHCFLQGAIWLKEQILNQNK